MKINTRNAVCLLTCGLMISTQSIAAGVIPGYGAAGTYNPALIIPTVATPAAQEEQTTIAGSASEGAGTASTSSALGISTPVLIGSAVAVAAVAAIAIGASSSSGGGSSAPTHSSR